MNKAIKPIIKIGEDKLNEPIELVNFTNNPQWDERMNNLNSYSHLFVLGCVGDKQIKAERAWSIPMKIGEEIGGFEFEKFQNLSLARIQELFASNKLHRFNSNVAYEYYEAIQKIRTEYDGDAKGIWETTNSSAAIYGRFLQFKGVGQKIASMAVNILLRHFKVDIYDKQWIDVSPDRHVIRVFKRTGIIRPEASKEEVIWKAREINPKYPGVFDLATFTIGREFCKQNKPLCNTCPVTNECIKLIK